MPHLIHIVGPQGSGKTSLAGLIVAGANGHAAYVDWDEALGLTNSDIRAAHADKRVVCVEALRLQARHSDLLPGDALMVVAAATEARHAA